MNAGRGGFGGDWHMEDPGPRPEVATDALGDARRARISEDVDAFLRTLDEIKRLPCTGPEEDDDE